MYLQNTIMVLVAMVSENRSPFERPILGSDCTIEESEIFGSTTVGYTVNL